jgi:hypothetical protein
MTAQLSGAEKQERIDQLRMINAVARKRLPKEFCDAVDDALLEAEDVATEQVQ